MEGIKMQANLGEVNGRKISAVRVSDNLMTGRPILSTKDDDIDNIKYHEPCGEGDKHFVDVCFKDGTEIRFFDVLSIQFESNEKK
jgi:hypothetical protein